MIVTTKNTCGGHPRIDGTRIEVFNIIDCLSDGMSIDEISKYYNVSIEEVKESIIWVKEFLIKYYDDKLEQATIQVNEHKKINKKFIILFYNRFACENQIYTVFAKNKFNARHKFWEKYPRKQYYDCIDSIIEDITN